MKSKEEHIEAAKKVKFIPAKDHGQKQPMRGYDNPNSHMMGWPTQRRMDAWAYPLIEIFCKHGVGHPMPESVEWCELQGKKMMDRHGCCGCCSPPRNKTSQCPCGIEAGAEGEHDVTCLAYRK